MLDQHVAKILLCGICISPFSSHADYLEGSVDNAMYDSYFPYEEFGDSKYASVEDDLYNYPFEYETEASQTVLASYMAPFSGYDDSYQENEFIQPMPLQPVQPIQPIRPIKKHDQKIRLGLQTAIDYLVGHNLDRTVAPKTVNVSNRELADTANALINWQNEFTPEAMENDFYLVDLTKESNAKSKFTGYYTPTLSAQLFPDSRYRYPIYKSPMSHQRSLSRAEISSGALANKGLEVAWTDDPVGLFYMQIQGSGVLQLPNGEKKSLKFDGSNGKKFNSIARYMQNQGLLNGNLSRTNIKKWLDANPYAMKEIFNVNPRYIYFKLNDGVVKTASGMPVIPGHTVAVDTDYIPFGSVVLAEVPILDGIGKVIGNEWRILFSQDRGNAIKGPARMDIYTGAGEAARKLANGLTGYGRAYLLITRPQNKQMITAALDANNQRL